MAIRLNLTLLMERRWPRTAFHLLPTQRYLNCFFRKNTLLWLCGNSFCALTWRFFLSLLLWKRAERAPESRPPITGVREVWAHPLFLSVKQSLQPKQTCGS